MSSIIKSLEALEIGGGIVQLNDDGSVQLLINPTLTSYSDAQVDDYHQLPRHGFPWYPPVRMSVRARASHHAPLGTLGFGFWNDPFTFSIGQGGAARRIPASPRAVWFFYGSPPNNLSFQSGMPGHGWKAMSMEAIFIPSIILAPLAGASLALTYIPFLRSPIIRAMLRCVSSAEQILDLNLTQWHQYELIWRKQDVRFKINGQEVFSSMISPRGPLGFVAWIDNQYAIVSPTEGIRFGNIPTQEDQWLQLSDVQIQAES
jgi:hypothetical protein